MNLALANRINSIEKEVDLLSIKPPAFIRPFLEEDRDPTPDERDLFCTCFERWRRAVEMAMARGNVSLQDLLDALPDRFRQRMRRALLDRIKAGTSETHEK